MRKIFCVFFLAIIIMDLLAFPYQIKHLGLENGLSNNCVLDITNDKLGFLWFATEEGLCKLNGNKFISFYKEENGLTGNELNCVMDDSTDSLIWIGTQRAGLNSYNYVTGQFLSYKNNPNDPKSIITNDITDIKPSFDGNIWISTYWGGVEYFNKKENVFVHFNQTTIPGLVSNKVWTIFDDGGSNLYLGHVDSGMSIISLGDRTVRNFKNERGNLNSIPGNEVNSIYKDSYGNLWVGTNKGLALYDSYNEKFFDFSTVNPKLGNYIFDIIQVDDKLWVTMDFAGVAVIDLSQHTFMSPQNSNINFIDSGYDSYSLSSLSVRCIHKDSFSNIWLGLWGGSVNFIQKDDNLFNSYVSFKKDSDVNSLDNSNVLTLCCLPNNTMLVGTNSGNISLIKKRKIDNIEFYSGNNAHVVQTSLCRRNGDILLGLFGGTLVKYDNETGKLSDIFPPEFDEIDVRSIYEDDNNNIWLSTSHGLYILEGQSYAVKSHFNIGNNLIRCVVSDKYNNVFVATYGNGLFIYDSKMNLLKTFEVADGFTSNTINHIYKDKNNDIWVATGEGLVRFSSGIYDKYTVYGRTEGLNNIHVRAIIKDEFENLWISTNRGISCLKNNSDFFLNYTENDNIPLGGFNTGCVSKDKDGIIYFGSTAGICFFNPYNILKDRENPIPIVSRVVVSEELTTQNKKKLEIFPDKKSYINLNDDQNNFYVSFNVLNYALINHVEYAYMLKGFDSSWYTVDNPENLSFRNIPYGNYELLVKCRIRNQNWTDNYTSVFIVINPPLWLTWWAKMIYFIIILIMIYLGLLFYKRRLNLSYLYKMEKESHIKEQELNQERLRFYTNITHELRTPLTLIIGPLEDLTNSATIQQKDKQKIGIIYQSSLRLLNLINQILEFRKTETQNRKLCVSKGNLCSTIYEIGLKFKELKANSRLDFIISSSNDNINIYYDKEILTMILDNLISNAFKYTKSGYIELSVGLVNIKGINYAEIKVIDTGYGISPEALPHIFDRYYQEGGAHQASGTGIGLALVKNLVELHKAEIQIASSVDKGTTFTILLKADFTYPDDLHGEDKVNHLVESVDVNNKLFSEEVKVNSTPIVLIVEDNEDIRQYMLESLCEDYDIRTASNGKIGLQMSLDIVPDIIVSDIMMPEMDGVEMCKAIKKNICTSHIPVILLTAKDTIHDKEEGYNVGADSYMTKPFSASLLKTRIKNLLDIRAELSKKYTGADIIEEKKKIIAESSNKMDSEFINKFVELVESNLSSEKVDVGYLSDKLCMSSSTLYRKVKALTGMSTNEFIRKIKMKNAEKLLLEGKYSISEIAFMVGMNSAVYFRQCFKDEFGVVPSDYIKQFKN